MSTINILIIENQYLQFRRIREKFLKQNDSSNGVEKYIVFPERSRDEAADLAAFKHFIDPVRIRLNKRYEETTFRKPALAQIVKYIADKAPHILIIDHKLVGHDDALTGIDLAKDLLPICSLPVLFLSKTPSDKLEVYKGLEGFAGKHKWMHKGYSDQEMFEDSFFVKEVGPEIEKLLEGSQEETVTLTLFGILERPVTDLVYNHDEIEDFRERMKKVKKLTEDEITAIGDYKTKGQNKNSIVVFFKQVLIPILERYEN